MRGLTRATSWIFVACSACGETSLGERAIGQYDFVEARFTVTGRARAETTLVAGRGRTFGNLILHPDGKLSGAGALSGMDAYITGTWRAEEDELRLMLDSIGSFPAPPQPLPAQLSGRDLTFEVLTSPPTVRRSYVVAMRSDLARLAAAQRSYQERSRVYTTDLQRLGFTSSPGINAPTLVVVPGGYSATMTHSRLPNVRCAVATAVKNPIDSTARDGMVMCDQAPERDSLRIRYTWRRST